MSIEADVIQIEDIIRRAQQARVARLNADPTGWAWIEWVTRHPLRLGGHGRGGPGLEGIYELDRIRPRG